MDCQKNSFTDIWDTVFLELFTDCLLLPRVSHWIMLLKISISKYCNLNAPQNKFWISGFSLVFSLVPRDVMSQGTETPLSYS